MQCGRADFPVTQRLKTALAATILLAFTAGCSHRRPTVYVPPPPAVSPGVRPETSLTRDEEFVETHRPIYTETGLASWYGPPYNHHAGANGEIYNENMISAANRTLPMESLIRVTDLRTGQAAVMRITDRGPFVPGRILDLSEGAAKAIGIWREGVGEVRIDVYYAPEPIDYGGRWCVQIGAFSHRSAARRLQARLEREYRSANVIEFQGPTGYWVRIRPYDGNKEVAVSIVRRLRPRQGAAFLVRLD